MFHTLDRGQRDSRLCPYLVSFATLYYSLPLSHPISITPPPVTVPPRTRPLLPPPPPPGPYHVYTLLIPPLHPQPPPPGVLSVSSHRSRSNHVAMKCTTVFCLLQMYSPITSNPTSSLAAAAEVYSHFTSVRLGGSLPLKRRATWSLNPPRTWPIRGVTTQVSAPKISTNWTTNLKKNQDTRSAALSLLRIIFNLCHTTRALVRFLTTTGQSFSAADITRPKYLKQVTISRGSPYLLKSIYVTGISSSSARRSLFIYSPFLHCAVRQCIPFISRHGTRMLNRGHRGWGRLTSSSITPVSRTCRCQKCTRIAILIASRKLHPSTGQGLGPDFARNLIINVLGSSPPSMSLYLYF